MTCYRILYFLIYWIIQFTLTLEKVFSIKIFKGKIAQIIEQKNHRLFFSRKTITDNPIWIHAASGELEYAKPLIREIKNKYPEKSILVTYFSTSALPMIEKVKEIDAWAPLPWDINSDISSFLDRVHPQQLIISRTDLWPNLIDHCKRRNINTLLMGATFAEGSKKIKGLGRWITGLALERLDKILVVNTEDQKKMDEVFQNQFHAKTTVAGDPRWDQVFFRIEEKRSLPPQLINWCGNELILVAGSTWPEDEVPLLDALSQLQLNFPWKILFVPHEIHKEHIENLKQQSQEKNFETYIWSEIQHSLSNSVSTSNSNKNSILIFDQMGLLADLYALAPWAFVGGGFKAQVHSVMEALAQGCHVLVGPYYQNNREAIEFKSIQYVKPCNSAEELRTELAKFSTILEEKRKGLAIREKVHSKKGATEAVLKYLN